VLLGHLNLLAGRFIQSGMDLQLQGKRALVTGSTAGIGLAIARGLAREGADVIINGRTAKPLDQSVAALNKAGVSGKVECLAADLGTAGGTRTAIEHFPEVDILVNNLGSSKTYPMLTGCVFSK
jgi:NAD(P)-dependent dehydrogenase (short-subunit alcohol dehydrogenase family)